MYDSSRFALFFFSFFLLLFVWNVGPSDSGSRVSSNNLCDPSNHLRHVQSLVCVFLSCFTSPSSRQPKNKSTSITGNNTPKTERCVCLRGHVRRLKLCVWDECHTMSGCFFFADRCFHDMVRKRSCTIILFGPVCGPLLPR